MLNVIGVKDALTSTPIVRPNDKEKQDRIVAKSILEKVGLEKEKYRLGYTKVKYRDRTNMFWLSQILDTTITTYLKSVFYKKILAKPFGTQNYIFCQ